MLGCVYSHVPFFFPTQHVSRCIPIFHLFNICNLLCCLFYDCFAEDEFVESPSTTTPTGSTEIDDEQEKHLLLQPAGAEDVTFVREARAK